MASHLKTIEFFRSPYTYEIEIDCEDPNNKVIEQVTIIGGLVKSDTDVDPDQFEQGLDDDDWAKIEELLEAAK